MNMQPSSFEETLKLLAALGAILSFLWGIWVWRDKSAQELAHARIEAQRLAESHRIEATKPFLERQLKLYTEASQVAAVLATSTEAAELLRATERFWELYWGELALVENKEVQAAMVALGRALETSADKKEVQQLSLRLAHACRRSLDKSWGINAWTTPDDAATKTDDS